MRNLFILRGCPASGKSTWIKQNCFEPYTLLADNIRTLYQSPILGIDGKLGISQNNDGEVWDLLIELLERRMSKGEMVIIDATHYKSSLLSRYKKLISKYRYRTFVVDFTGVPIDELLKRNNEREEYKYVPEDVILKMYEVFKSDTEVSKRFNVITPDEAVKNINSCSLFDFNDYSKVVVFGDIHGCYEPLKQYFDNNPMSNDTMYVFTGDYIDRGVQNKEVLEFLLTIYKNKNVLLLEGNHENWLRMYSNDEYITPIPTEDLTVLRKYLNKKDVNKMLLQRKIPSVFLKSTRPEIESLLKSDLRELCRKFGQMAYFTFGDKKYFITHGGISCLPSVYFSTHELIKGVGKYEDLQELYENWNKNTDGNTVLVHAHRNIFDLPVKVNENIYNLCDKPEFGENMRIIEIYKDNIKPVLIKNTVYNHDLEKQECFNNKTQFENIGNDEIIKELENSKYVRVKKLDNNIKSYNFTSRAFTKRKWNQTTCTARGLFIDGNNNNIIAKSYNKFYNWGEVESTESKNLAKNLVFPVVAYRKENGFLGIVSYNPYTDDLFISSKSTNDGEFAEIAKEHILCALGDKSEKFKQYLKENNSTAVFEVIDVVKDPHIIKYDDSKVVLLDVIKNTFENICLKYEDLCKVANDFNLNVKQVEYTFDTWQELYDFKHQQDVSYDVKHEGWVFVDQNNFMVKYKTRFYKFWKYIRGIKHSLQSKHNITKNFRTKEEVMAYNILKEYTPEQLQTMSIIDIEDIFYSNYNN